MGVRLSFRMLFLASLAGLGSHALLDYTNSYGIRPFLPFDGRWFAADLVFIVDPWMLAILAGGLLLPFLFRLIHQEIGAKAGGSGGGAFVASTLVVAILGGQVGFARKSPGGTASSFVPDWGAGSRGSITTVSQSDRLERGG